MKNKHPITDTIQLVAEPHAIEVPAELMELFKAEKDARALFDKLAYTHKREYVKWINEAKRNETRQARALKTIVMLKKGKKEK